MFRWRRICLLNSAEKCSHKIHKFSGETRKIMEEDAEEFNLDLPEDLEDVEVIYSDGEPEDNDEIEEMNTAETENVNIIDTSSYTFTKHTKSVFVIDLSPDQRYLVSGSEDDTSYVWDLATRNILFECTGHKDSVTQACFNHDGQLVATADMSGMVQVWSVAEKKLVWCNAEDNDDLEWMQWHPFANVLIIGLHSGDVYIWQIPQNKCKVLPTHGAWVNCGKVLPDGKTLVAGYEDGQIKLWDMKSAQTLWQLTEPCDVGITALDISLDGSLLAVAPTSQLFLLSTGRNIANLQSNLEKDIEAVLISSELGVVVTGSLSGELCVWDLVKHTLRHRAKIENSVTVIKSGKDGKMFVGTTDGAIYVCDVRNGSLLKTLTGHRFDILDIAVAKSGEFIISASDDCTIKIFDV